MLLRVVFNSNYPSSPPFIRVIRPRFQFHTGHVTIGQCLGESSIETRLLSVLCLGVANAAPDDRSNKFLSSICPRVLKPNMVDKKHVDTRAFCQSV